MERGTKRIAIAVAVLLVAVAMAGCLDDDGDSEPCSYDGACFRFNMDKTYVSYYLSPPNTNVIIYVYLNNTADDNASLDGALLETTFYLDGVEQQVRTVNATPDHLKGRTVSEGGYTGQTVKFIVDGVDLFSCVVKFEMKLIFEGTKVDKQTYEEIRPMKRFRFNLDDTYAEYELGELYSSLWSSVRLYVAIDNIASGKASMDGFKLEASIRLNGTGLAWKSSWLSGDVYEGRQEIVLLDFPHVDEITAGAALEFEMKLTDQTKDPSLTTVDAQTYEDVAVYMDLEFRLNLDDTYAEYEGYAWNLVRLYVALDNIADGEAALDDIQLGGQYYMNGVLQWDGTVYASTNGDVSEGGRAMLLLEFYGKEPILSGAVLEFKMSLTHPWSDTVDRQTYEEVVP